jgi:peroxiredoxin Q/BCP
LEAQDFNNFLPEFARLWAQILGVSKDSHRSHCNFIWKYDLLFPLISDPEWVLHKQFGAVGEKSLYGRKYMGTIRSTYLLNQQGTILHQWNDVKVQWHVQSVLDTLSSLV